METSCQRWHQINVAALSLGELRRAAGGGAGFWLSLPLYLVARLIRRRMLAPDLVPDEITAVARAEVEIPVPEAFGALGFTPLVTLSLPEFSGRNLIHMLADSSRETICEFLVAWSERPGATWQGANFVLASGLENGQLLRTITSPRSYPTQPPPGHHVVLGQGMDPAALTAQHGEALRRLAEAAGSPPIVFDEARCIEVARRSHRELVACLAARGVFVEAEPTLVEALFRENELTRPARARDAASPRQEV